MSIDEVQETSSQDHRANWMQHPAIQRITLALLALVATMLMAVPPHAAADSDLTLKDPWTSSCYQDRTAIDKRSMTRDDGFTAGQVTVYYSPSCQTNWLEVYTPIGINDTNRGVGVNMFIGLTTAPWTNDMPEYRYENHGQLTNEFRTMMIHAPGATCIHYWAGVSDYSAYPEGDALLGGTTDKTICG